MTKDEAKREAYRIMAWRARQPIDVVNAKARGLGRRDQEVIRLALDEIAAAMERAAGGGT